MCKFKIFLKCQYLGRFLMHFFLQRLTWVVSWLLGTRQKASLNILMVGKSFILMENFSLRNFCRLWIRTVEMLPTFFSYTAISYMLFCFSPFLCLSLVSVRCCALCFCWLIFFSSIHFFLPHFPTNSLIMQLKPSTFPLSLLRSGLILFLIEETEAMNFMILYGLSLESTFEHLFFLVV